MTALTEEQIMNGYFHTIGGFPPSEIVHEVKDYTGGDHLCIACTQLDYHGYSERDKKRILAEWIDYLRTNTKLFRALHFNSRVPQALFDAACCQANLEELRFKWGAYSDLSALENLNNLKMLYIGSGAGVSDIQILGKMKNLIVLYIENFKRIENYAPLSTLNKLEQLVISGPILGRTPIIDIEFLRELKSLVTVWLPNTKFIRKYTSRELADLRSSLPLLHDSTGVFGGINDDLLLGGNKYARCSCSFLARARRCVYA
jgi:Leucine-rich repeat (LRR) protein